MLVLALCQLDLLKSQVNLVVHAGSSDPWIGSSEKNCKLECGPVPNVMVALLNIGGALCSTPQSLADAHY